MEKQPEISIVTPSFNMLPYLKLCCASVQDQGVDLEHIVMDGQSNDGTQDWLRANTLIVSKSEKDNGMYNALNKAIKASKGQIIGHLNCDEQYLPGTLKFVIEFFKNNPDVDFITGDYLVVDQNGQLMSYRKAFAPRWPYFFSNYLYTATCTLFYRSRIFDTCRFDESYRSIADVIFLYNVLRSNFKGIHVQKYFSTFTYSGSNLSLDPISDIEKERFGKLLPAWFRIMRPFFKIPFFAEKLFWGAYVENAPLTYAIYFKENLRQRKTIIHRNPTFRLKFKVDNNT